MNSIISKLKIALVSIIIAGMILVGTPLVTQAAGAILYSIKEFGLDVAARLIASRLLGNTSKRTIELIKTKGREGGSALVKDWRSFIVRSDQRGENVFRSQISYVTRTNKVCPGSRSTLSQIFGATNVPGIDIGQLSGSLRANNLDLFQTRVKCTVPDNVWNDFQQDFQRGGGWETWSRLVEPQNNRFGLLALSLEELTTQRLVERKADEGETRASGFLPKRGPCQGQGLGAQCTFFGQIVTPKQILEASGVETAESAWEWLFTSDELSEVLIGLIDFAFNSLDNWVGAKTDGIIDLGSASDIGQDDEREQAINACVNDCLDFRDVQCQQEARQLSCDASGGSAAIDSAIGGSVSCTDEVIATEYNDCINKRNNVGGVGQSTCNNVCIP